MLPEEVRAVMEAPRRGLRPVAAHAHSIGGDQARAGKRRADDRARHVLRRLLRATVQEQRRVPHADCVRGGVRRQTGREILGQRRASYRRKGCAAGRKPRWRIRDVHGGPAFDSASAATRAVAMTLTRRRGKSSCSSRAAVPAADAIAAATVTNAEILGMQDRLGRIRPGFEADLIAVERRSCSGSQPKLHSVSFVMKGGAIVIDRGRQPPA